MHWAVFHGNAALVRRLLDAGADVNALTEYQVSPLSIACRNGDAKIARSLLKSGADANAQRPAAKPF